MKNKKFSEQKFQSIILHTDLYRLATAFVQQFTETLPVLSALGVLDDDSIRRYMHFNSFEEVYKDAQRRNGERVRFAEDMAKLRKDDFWKPIRELECKAASPSDKGFVFRDIPFAYDPNRGKALKGVSVKNCVFEVSDKVIREESFVAPSASACECYNLVSDFCKKFNAKNFNRSFKVLFALDENGKLKPNELGIMWGKTGASMY